MKDCININPKNSNKSKTSKNVILFNGPSEKKVNKKYDDTSVENKFKNIRNKQKNISEIKNGRNKINKSSFRTAFLLCKQKRLCFVTYKICESKFYT